MEFDADVWNGICTFHSHDGRQIGENNSNPAVYKEVVETEHKICKFEGSRNGLPINVTALRQVMAVWPDALQFTTMLRNDYIRRRGLDSARLTLCQGYVFSKLGAAYPAYLARKRSRPITSLPALETAFFTLGVGPFMVVRTLMEKGDLSVLRDGPLTATELYEMADRSGTLVSAAGNGCAGSKKLIIDYLDVTMNGTFSKPLDSAEARRAVNAIEDWDEFYGYVYATARLELLVRLTQYLCAQSLWMLQARDALLSDTERSLVSACLAKCYHDPGEGLDDRTVMGHCIRIVLALLDEVDFPQARAALVEANLVHSGNGGYLLDQVGGDARVSAARRMRLVTELLLPFCKDTLDATHRALQRFTTQTITLDDVQRRACGPSLQPLLAMLETRPAQQGTPVGVPA
ncbi:hypothetical protein [Sphaerotilus sp.]|uniref:hypothetical protein n=1 Tax=Sphaerotilus sp. TaxID=2093942 RepID=UPI0025E22FAA|nr:hypothetical protein [Sphaerotilus sp.]